IRHATPCKIREDDRTTVSPSMCRERDQRSSFMSNTVRDNTKLHRFELDTDGHIAFSEYQRGNGVLTIMHTEVPKALEGRGIGSALIRGVLNTARAQGLKLRPVCPFAKAYIERHSEYADLMQI